MDKVKRLITALSVLTALLALLLCPAETMASARYGLELCAGVIAPSLLPFLVLSSAASGTGLTAALGRLLSPLTSRLFGVSGAGGAAFVLGVTGGYPIGAAAVADLTVRGELSADEGSRLLMFCNNSGPAFIVGAAGVGVFGDGRWGLLLYLCHVLAAVTAGVLFRGGAGPSPAADNVTVRPSSLAEALPAAVKSSCLSLITICGFVVTFSVVAGVLDALGVFTALTGRLAVLSGMGLTASRALLTGLLELGGGIGRMRSMPLSAGSLALCSFILGWGGLSVHFQTAAVCAGSGVKTARHTVGRLVIGIISALYAYGLGLLTLPRI